MCSQCDVNYMYISINNIKIYLKYMHGRLHIKTRKAEVTLALKGYGNIILWLFDCTSLVSSFASSWQNAIDFF